MLSFRRIPRISSRNMNSERNSERMDLYSKCLGNFIEFLEYVISNPNNTNGIIKEKTKLINTINTEMGTVDYITPYPTQNTKYKKCLTYSVDFLTGIQPSNINVGDIKKLLEEKKKEKKKIYLPFIIIGSIIGGILLILIILYIVFYIKINRATHRN